MRCFWFVLLAGLVETSAVSAQVYSNKPVGRRNAALIDSLKQQEYPYALPIWGDKAAKMGFQLPYSAGVSVQYFWQESDLIIDNLSVGFNHGPQTSLDEVIRFDGAQAAASAVSIRPDVWLFPFLNVYGLLAKAKTSTAIDAGLWLPDSTNSWNQISAFSTTAKFDATSFGFGITPTIGISDGWLALDMNMLWSDVSALDKPVFTFVFGPRFGKTFKFKTPERNLAVWAGGFRVKFTSETEGSLDLSEVIDIDGAQGKLDESFAKVEETRTQVEAWWNGLSPAEKENPLNQARYATANRAIERATRLLTDIDGALSTASTSTVQYSLDKNLKDMWNLIIGAQFQLNRHYMIRVEGGFLGSRTQFLTGLQYRFGL